MLYRSELKKLTLVQKGLLTLAVCLLLKVLCLSLVPEQKDYRISLSQKQYDKYLTQLHGENTAEKSAWILADYANGLDTISKFADMEKQYRSGKLSEEAWEDYLKRYDTAKLHQNSSEIFAEKAQQFEKQPDTLPAAHYIYEYGWQTIFRIHQLPDIFLLFGLLILSAQCLTSEYQSGMLSVLLACKNGRHQLLNAKLLALLTVCGIAALLSAGIEAAVFCMRGWCNDSGAPLYSIALLTNCTLPLSLVQGYVLSLLLRSFSAVLIVVFLFSCSVWLKNIQNTIFVGILLLALPLLWNSSAMLYLPSGFLIGTRVLQLQAAPPLFVPALAGMAATAGLYLCALRRFCQGI